LQITLNRLLKLNGATARVRRTKWSQADTPYARYMKGTCGDAPRAHCSFTESRNAVTAEVVVTSLPDDSALESAASGPDGILAGLTERSIWVDVSTVSPRVSRALAERARERGAAMLDAPVSGSVPQVRSGTLTIMVGGDGPS
jgi:3-hydroxyisobutyrate dehydrogenase-like beta-hydroxyacid dehydrogenase